MMRLTLEQALTWTLAAGRVPARVLEWTPVPPLGWVRVQVPPLERVQVPPQEWEQVPAREREEVLAWVSGLVQVRGLARALISCSLAQP